MLSRSKRKHPDDPEVLRFKPWRKQLCPYECTGRAPCWVDDPYASIVHGGLCRNCHGSIAEFNAAEFKKVKEHLS